MPPDSSATSNWVLKYASSNPNIPPVSASTRESSGSVIGSGDSRVTETAVRGLWQTWRRYMKV